MAIKQVNPAYIEAENLVKNAPTPIIEIQRGYISL